MFGLFKRKSPTTIIIINPDWKVRGKYRLLKKEYRNLENKYWVAQSYIEQLESKKNKKTSN